ncbi:hypothetical protein L226DRAFT_446698, partial [Lentinus tigrinus ALCF2SS1-7]|uniref:uncharacterized protein n=1 Tax=Lentinus tigrinus ALCF2SS1-7 TaxID=1328758 RepID=UPI00116612A5
AAAPFDRNDADFMLRSSDNVEFRVHRLILSMASFVFESMFSMPKPPTLPSDPPGIPEISIPEDSETLDLFLRICYPLIDPEVQTLLLLRKVLTAGIKYDAPMVIHAMKRELRQPRFMDTQPLRAFAIACLCDLEEEAKIAAEISVVEGVVISKASSSPEVDEISAGAYYRLLRLNRTRAASTLTPLPVVTPSLSSPFTSLNHDGADIVLHTKDSVDFFVHRVIVTFASPTFLSSLSKERTSEESENQRPVYLLAEDSHTTDILLRMCYPVDHPDIPSSDHYLDVACAAHRYGFCKVEQTLLRSWSEHATNAPLRFYFAAVQCGWEAEARACARQLVTTLSPKDLDDAYVPEMESVSSVPYRRLLSYAEACR